MDKPQVICLSEVMFYISFALLFGYRAFGGVDGPWFYTPMVFVAVGFSLLKVFMTEHTRMELVLICLLYLCACITYIRTGEKGLIINFALMLGMKGIQVKRLFRFAAWILAPAMFLVTMPYALGIIEDPVAMRMAPRLPWMEHRYCLGYPHTNTLLTTYVILIMLVMYLCGYKSRKRVLITSSIMGCGALFLWLWCDSKTGILITVLYLLMNLYFGYHAKFGCFDKTVVYGLYPLINVIVIGGTILHQSGYAGMDTIFFSLLERFRLTHMYWVMNPVTLFGVRIKIPETQMFAIDISQIHLLLNLGIVAFAVVTILYFILFRDCIGNKKRGELPIILCLMIMGITDPLLYNLSCKNLTFLFMGVAMYRWLAGRYDDVELNNSGDPIHLGGSLSCFMQKKVRLIPIGTKELPRLTDALVRFDSSARRVFVDGTRRNRILVAAIISVIVALVWHFATVSMIEPINDNMMAGIYLHILNVLSAGVYSFIIGYGIACIIRIHR